MKRILLACCPLLCLLAGCLKPPAAPPPPPPPPEVKVAEPVYRDVTDYEEFPGRTEAVESIDLRARVTGYLKKINFEEGALVTKGQVLFEIDPPLYEAELARAEANVVQAEARLQRLTQDCARANEMYSKKAIGREEYDKIMGDRNEASAAVGVAVANRTMARTNMNYTKVTSPIDGRISRRYIDPGNLVKADDTVLTTIVSQDPIHAYFDVDERATLRLKDLIKAGKLNFSCDAKVPVLMGLANEDGFSQRGVINFADNRVDPDTGTWRLRGRFDNPKGALTPGLFVRIRLPIGDPYKAMLVSEQALGTDQGQRFVYVIEEDPTAKPEEKKKIGTASSRRVQVGRVHDGLRVITEGLKPNEKIVVSGLQRVRPGAKVTLVVVSMPGGEKKE